MRRWLLRILVAVAVLIVLAVVAIQLVLWSDIPRKQAVPIIEQQLGVAVTIDSLRIGWTGSTSIKGVELATPLDDKPTLTVPTIHAEHTALPWLALGATPTVQRVTIDGATADLRRDQTGRWNLARLIETISATAKAQQSPDAAPTAGPIDLPRLALRNATVRITPDPDAPNHTAALQNVRLTGQPAQGLDYKLKLTAPDLGDVDITLSRSAPHAHEVAFNLKAPTSLLQTLNIPPRAYAAEGTWRGRLTETGPVGELVLDSANVPGALVAHGRCAIAFNTNTRTLTLQPRNLIAEPTVPMLSGVELAAGRIGYELTEKKLTLTDLQLAALGGTAQVSGAFRPFERVGRLEAAWESISPAGAINHTARLQASLEPVGPAHRRLHATLDTEQLRAPLGDWRGRAELTAIARNLQNADATLTFDQLRLTRSGRTQRLPSFRAELSLAAPEVALQRLTMPDARPDQHLDAQGAFNWRTGAWSARLDAEHLPLPITQRELLAQTTLRLSASGNKQAVTLHDGRVEVGGIVADLTGALNPDRAEPVDLQVDVQRIPIRVSEARRAWLDAENLAGRLQVRGTLQPLKLQGEGNLTAKALRVHRTTVGDLALGVRAVVSPEALSARAQAVEWLGGQWGVSLSYPLAGGDEPSLTITGDAIQMPEVGKLANVGDALTGEADLRIETTPPTQERADQPLQGSFELREPRYAGIGAQNVTGKLQLRNGELRVHDITATEQDGKLNASIALPLETPTDITVDASLNAWPLPTGALPVSAQLSGEGRVQLDAAAQTGRGVFDWQANAALNRDDAPARELTALQGRVSLAGSDVRLAGLRGKLLEGQVTGEASIDLHNPLDVLAEVNVQNVQPAQLSPFAQPLEQTSGALSASLTLAPTKAERAIGPVVLKLRLDDTGVSYRGLPIGGGRATLYFDQGRYVLHDARIALVGGSVEMWGRVIQPHHDRTDDMDGLAGARFLYAEGSAEDIDLGTLTRTLQPDKDPILGRLGGQVTVNTQLGEWESAFGTGSLKLRDSDLANLPIISLLYDVVNIRFGDTVPQGEGDARFRIEEGLLVFDRFHYTNRGTQLELAGRVENLWAGNQSPIDGYALVSVTPLPEIALFETINTAIEQIQAGATTLYLSGTLAEPKATPAAFEELTKTIGSMLGGSRYDPPASSTQPAATQPAQ